MAKSSASFIAYDMRPAKQTERRGLVEFFNSAKSAGYDLSQYRYVGFGGTKFIDFQLMERYVGFSSYVSIEHDEDIFNRCSFNKPYESIRMFEGEFSTFQSTDTYTGNSVHWLDYEVGLVETLVTDIRAFAGRCRDGDMLLVTIKADVPKGKNTTKAIIKSRLPGFGATIDKLKPEAFTDRRWPDTTGFLLLRLLEGLFAPHINVGRFHPYFRVLYKDSNWMCTVGGVFAKNGSKKAGKLGRVLQTTLPTMCQSKRGVFYRVPVFNFTPLERHLLDKSDVGSRNMYLRRLRMLGVSEEEIASYKAVSRYVPKYLESVI